MNSKRYQILNLIKELLETVQITGRTIEVHINRLNNIKSGSKDLILIESSDENVIENSLGFPREQQRKIDILIYCVATANLNKYEFLDTLSTAVQKKIFSEENYNLSGKVSLISMTNLTTENLTEIGTGTVADILSLTVDYYTLENEIDHQL